MLSRQKFILASSSPRRLALLKDIGITPDQVIAADIDEAPLPIELPRVLAERLALQKLQAVMPRLDTQSFILSADTVVAVGRRVLPKAENAEDVRACWTLMQGRKHHVTTAMALHLPNGKILQRTCDSHVTFRQLSTHEIEIYAASGEGVGKAGGYAIQGRAAADIRVISGSYSNIVGLPLFELAQWLRGNGFVWSA